MTQATTETATQGRTIEREIVLKAAPERVFRALTDPAELVKWFTHSAEVDLRPGGTLRFTWADYGAVPGRILEVDPPRRFVYAWTQQPDVGETTIAIDLEPVAEGTRLRVVHTGFETGPDWDRIYVEDVETWPKELENLRAWLEDGRPRPRPW
jgi:uncharacterized protein YndB with AHSA1/START domain